MARRIIWHDLRELSAVTAQVLTIYRSQISVKERIS
jgi:hypothetical protein